MSDDDDDELEELDEPPARGRLELADPDHEEHPAGWIYTPDLTSETGYSAHRVPTVSARARRRFGFGRG